MNSAGLLVLVFVSALAKHTPGAREGRWFRGAYTETKIQQEIVTSLIPSSCVHVAATLPACKSVRSLRAFPEFGGQEIYPDYLSNRQIIEGRNINENSGSQKIVLAPIEEDPSEIGWAEYLGLTAPTVTITEIDLKTTTVFDPRTVVTFSVRGCQPSKLPLDLNACDVPKQNLNDISPTKILLDAVVTPTIFENNKDDANVGYNQLRNIEVESSASSIPSKDIYYVPTEELTNARFRKY